MKRGQTYHFPVEGRERESEKEMGVDEEKEMDMGRRWGIRSIISQGW